MRDEIIYHHGIKGMKWGVRRYQNEDGTLTPAGKKRRSLGVAGELAVKGTASIHKGLSKIQSRQAKSVRKDEESIRSQKNEMLSLKGKDGKPLFTEKDIDDMISSLDKRASSIESKARKHKKFANQLLKEIGDMRIRDSKEKTQQKQYVKLDSSYIESRKPSKKDLQKEYVNLDDTLNGAKYLNKKAAKYAEDALEEIDRQLSGDPGSYDAKKINDLIDKAMMAIDDELSKG